MQHRMVGFGMPNGLQLCSRRSILLIKSPHIRSLFTAQMRPLTLDSLNPGLRKVEYAVRGELAIKAHELTEVLRDELKKPSHSLPFDKVISSNIGNPQQKGLDQPPITFNRQVCIPYRSSVIRTPVKKFYIRLLL